MGVLKNQRHELFAQAVAKGVPASRAYVDAGYQPSDANASILKGTTKVATRVAELQQGVARRVEVDQAWVLKKLIKVAKMSMAAVPVLDGDGEPTGEYKFDSAGATKSLALIGKHLGMFNDKIQHEHSGMIALKAMPTEVIEARVIDYLQTTGKLLQARGDDDES